MDAIAAALSLFIGATLNALIVAGVLMWRARVRMRWFIGYRTAAWVGLKAAWFAVLAAIAVVLAFAFAGIRDEQFLDATAALVAILAWWLAHTNGLLKLRANRVLTPAEARALSANVFGYWLVGLFLFSLAVVLVALLVSRVL